MSKSLPMRIALGYAVVGVVLQMLHGASLLNPLTYMAAPFWLPGLVLWIGGLASKMALLALVVAAGLLGLVLVRHRLGHSPMAED